jgi:hypothetical protein
MQTSSFYRIDLFVTVLAKKNGDHAKGEKWNK